MQCLISEQTLADRKKFFVQKCKEHGLRITPQKEKIYDALASRNDHPTAQEIYMQVQKTFPTLSFATVYKNLSLFADKHMIQVLDFGEGVSRFDAEINHHCHVFDQAQKKVYDVFLNQIPRIPFPSSVKPASVKRIDITYFL